MNCASARNRLLAQADPADVPDPVAGHLATCTACSAWHALLIQVDAVLLATPVPVAGKGLKKQVLGQFQTASVPKPAGQSPVKPATRAGGAIVVVAAAKPIGDHFARLWPVGAVAAAVLVGALAWAILGNKGTDGSTVMAAQKDPFLEKVVQAKVDLDTADGGQNRLKILDRLAGNIHDQAKDLSKVTPGAEMDSLAAMYEQVVTQLVDVAARELSSDERKEHLQQFVESLSKAEQEANRLASIAPVKSDRPLRDIARVAGMAKEQLARMQQGRV